MKKLLVYLKDYKKESVLGPLFKLLEATFELIVPLVMAAIIDTGVADRGQVLYYENVYGAGTACSDRSDLLDHRTVFRGKGGSRVCNKTAPCAVCTH